MATVEIDGELWDDETGNYLGPKSNWIEGDIDSEEKAMVFMRRHLELSTELAARKAQLDAVKANIEKLLADQAKRLEWLEARYSWQMAEYARQNLGKTKTWRNPFGTVSFRTSSPKVTVVDEGKAIEWAEVSCPSAVKVKRSLLISQVPETIKAQILSNPDEAAEVGFGVVPAEDTYTIKTGGNE